MTRTTRIMLFVAVILFVVAAADTARAEWWEGWEPKTTLPTQAAETLNAQAVVLIPPVTIDAQTHAIGVEQWEPVVAAHFPEPAVTDALSVMWCESRGNPDANNPRSSAAGLFQFIRSTWDWVAPNVGAGTYDSGAVYDPVANIRAAHWLWSITDGWSHWECRP